MTQVDLDYVSTKKPLVRDTFVESNWQEPKYFTENQ